MRRRLEALLTLAVLFGPAVAWAQFQQYTAPGQLVESRETMQELLERRMKESRWRLGRTFLDPWIGVRDIAYVDNVQGAVQGEQQSDLTASLGIGLRAYRPIGSELTLAAYALPQYVWWRELTDRRRVNGRYGAGLFGNLGRTGLELTAARSEDALFFSRELEVPVNTRLDRGAAQLEIDLVGDLSLFAGAELRRVRYLDEDDPALSNLDLLDRDEEILRAGVRFHLFGALEIGVGAEDSTVDFDAGERDRSNRGTSPVLQVEFRGSGLRLGSSLAWRDLEPEPGSAFVPYEEVTGNFQLEAGVAGRLRPQLYGRRNLVYAIDPQWAYFEDTGFGVGLRASLGSSAGVRLFVEQGTNDYIAFGGALDRRDEYRARGGELRIRLGRFSLLVGATRTRYDSDAPQFDRDVTVIRSGLVVGSGGDSPWG
jgi:hypothetical protein